MNQNDFVALMNASLVDWFDEKPKPEFTAGTTVIKTAYPSNPLTDYQYLLQAVLENNWSQEGHFTRQAQELMSIITHQDYISFCNSGSSANLLAFSALNEQLGCDRVITTGLNFSTTLSPALQLGKDVILIDTDPETLSPDFDQLDACLNMHDEFGVVLAHTLGFPFDETEIEARMFNHWLLVDACDALGASRNGYPVGNLADLSTYSFFPAHQANAAQGGAVCSNSKSLTNIVESYRNWGRDCWCPPNKDNTCGLRLNSKWPGLDHKFVTARLGYNLQTTELNMALLASQLNNNFEEIQPKRMQVFEKLKSGLSDLSEYLQCITVDPSSNPSPFYFPLLLKSPLDKLTMMRYLEAHKIQVRPIVNGDCSKQPAFIPYVRSGQIQIPYPLTGAEEITKSMIGISCSQHLSSEMIIYIIETLHTSVKEMIK